MWSSRTRNLVARVLICRVDGTLFPTRKNFNYEQDVKACTIHEANLLFYSGIMTNLILSTGISNSSQLYHNALADWCRAICMVGHDQMVAGLASACVTWTVDEQHLWERYDCDKIVHVYMFHIIATVCPCKMMTMSLWFIGTECITWDQMDTISSSSLTCTKYVTHPGFQSID